AELVGGGLLLDRQPLGEVVQPDPRRDEDRQPARGRHAREVMVVLELSSRRGARAEEGTPAAALHPEVVVDEAHQAWEEAGGEKERQPREAAVAAVRQRVLHRPDGLAEDVPQQEDQDSRRGRGEEGLRRRLDALHPSDRQPEKDRAARDRAEAERLQSAHVRVTLQARISHLWRRATQSTSTWRRSTSSRSRSANTAP